MSPTIPLHCLVPPIFKKPQAKPRHKRKDKTVKSYQSSGRRTKPNKSVPCSACVTKALAMRRLGLPGQDFNAFHQGFSQAYDNNISSSSRISQKRGSYPTTKILGVRLPRILSNKLGCKRGSVGAIPDRLNARGITSHKSRGRGAQKCTPHWRAS